MNLKKVIKSPIFYIVTILLAVLFTFDNAVSPVFSNNVKTASKELPIYCVDTDKKYVAISFDAAWGNARYGILHIK